MASMTTLNSIVKETKEVMQTHLPLVFANGSPISLESMNLMELEEFFLYLLSCECGRPIQNLTDIDQPSWWPPEVTFKENLLEILSEEEMSSILKNLIRECYLYHKSDILLEFSEKLMEAYQDTKKIKVIDNGDGTRSMRKPVSGKLLVTFRSENQDYDLRQRQQRKSSSPERSPDQGYGDEPTPEQTVLEDHDDKDQNENNSEESTEFFDNIEQQRQQVDQIVRAAPKETRMVTNVTSTQEGDDEEYDRVYKPTAHLRSYPETAKILNYYSVPESEKLTKMRQRKSVKTARKETKNVKTVTVTQGDVDDYNIDRMLQNLEVSGNKTKPKRKRKKKKKNDCEKPEEEEIENIGDPDQSINASEHEGAIGEPIVNVENPDEQPVEVPTGPWECSTCFEPRIRTFLLVPCGHATFCEKCATYLCDSEDKRCPTCRAIISGKIRVFL